MYLSHPALRLEAQNKESHDLKVSTFDVFQRWIPRFALMDSYVGPNLLPKHMEPAEPKPFFHADLVDLCSLYLLPPSLGRGSLFPCVCVGEVN